jgi:DNA polymerase
MSDELRREAASIARAVRRKVERERALGAGELLASGVARARGAEIALSGPVATSVAVEAAPAAPAAPAGFTLTPPEVTTRVPKRAANRDTSAEELPHIELPPFTDDLYPSALAGGRDALATAALPVLDTVAAEARACTKCGLCTTRTNAVPGVGSARSGIVFVGEAPGADEDARGEPFVGRAGELLTKMIAAMDEKKLIPGVTLSRETVYIANVLKCRPPENRNPLPHEIDSCSPYLLRQLEALQPRIICCLGKFAAELLLQLKGTVTSMRGKTYRWRGAKLVVTYHPAYLLRSPSAKRPVWDDLQRLAQEYLTD